MAKRGRKSIHVSDNKRKLVAEMIHTGVDFTEISRVMEVSYELVATEFQKIVKKEQGRRKPTTVRPRKYDYLITEEEILFSLSPTYSVDELKGEELTILKALK